MQARHAVGEFAGTPFSGGSAEGGGGLEVLDEVTRPLVVEATFDEIFAGQQPILMGVEPSSFCWITAA